MHELSGPVLRNTARLSQRYPPIARYGVFGVSTLPIGCDTPSPFLSISPMESMRSGGAIPTPPKGCLSDTCAIPYENKTNGCDAPLCDTISKGYCAIRGVSRTGLLSARNIGRNTELTNRLHHLCPTLKAAAVMKVPRCEEQIRYTAKGELR